MPQLNPEFFVSQLFWLAIFFTFLLIFLSKVTLPRIAVTLKKRQDKIDKDLTSAKELQEQAKNIEVKINQQINTAKNEADEQIKKTINTLQDEVSSKLNFLDKELEEKILLSEKEILEKKDEQMKNIKNEISDIAKITISKISDINISNSIIDETVKSIKGNLN